MAACVAVRVPHGCVNNGGRTDLSRSLEDATILNLASQHERSTAGGHAQQYGPRVGVYFVVRVAVQFCAFCG